MFIFHIYIVWTKGIFIYWKHLFHLTVVKFIWKNSYNYYHITKKNLSFPVWNAEM